uniref:ATP-binding cassette transporter n=1 Tax=Solanum tuberosum TaxID=4113 RepID=M1CTL7_SOLTU
MSSRAEDDEEALKWATIRRGILSEQGQSREVDVTDLGLVEKRNFLERLVKIAEGDNEKFLLKLKQRIDR